MEYADFRDQFAAAMDSAFYNIGWLDGLIESGAAVCITAGASAIIVTVKTYPTGLRQLYGMYAAGDVNEIIEVLIPQAEALGRELGCSIATIESREAWGRLLKDYTMYKITVQKRL
jgi:hypothetical protein